MTDTATAANDDHEVLDDHAEHGASDRQMIVLALFLAIITGLEVAVHYVDIGVAHVPSLIVMMVVKFVIVVSYFMHLKFELRIFKALFYSGVFLAISVYVLALFTFHFFD